MWAAAYTRIIIYYLKVRSPRYILSVIGLPVLAVLIIYNGIHNNIPHLPIILNSIQAHSDMHTSLLKYYYIDLDFIFGNVIDVIPSMLYITSFC